MSSFTYLANPKLNIIVVSYKTYIQLQAMKKFFYGDQYTRKYLPYFIFIFL